MAANSNRQLILDSGLFDPDFYLRRHPDVAAAGVDPATHYLEWGGMEGRRPHPFFDGVWYLRRNPDLTPADNPLLHYLKHGRREGRRGQKRCVVYTSITRQYDDLRPPVVNDPEVDYIVFADEHLPERLPEPWIRVGLPKHDGRNESLASRFCKTHPHTLLAGYDVSAWVDGAFRLRNLTADAMEAVIRTGPIAFFPHPKRICAYEEAEAVKGLERDTSENVDSFLRRLEEQGFPHDAGLVETGFIIRDHHDPRIVAAMEEWWELIRNGSRRDQLSINFVMWKQNLQYVVLPRNSRRNEWACFMGHRPPNLVKAREELTRLEWELLDLQTTIEFIRTEKRIERNLKLAGNRRSDSGGISSLTPPDTRTEL